MGIHFNSFIESLLIGLAIAAPVGPIGVLCIRRTLAYGIAHGFASGMGAATADALYGSIIAFGLTALSALLLNAANVLQIGGGLFLIYLGVRTLIAPVIDTAEAPVAPGSRYSAYASTLALTITNPMTMLAFIGIFAGIGDPTADQTLLDNIVIVLGVFTGSALWWLTLSLTVGLLRRRVTPTTLTWINRISGAVIIAFARQILFG